MCPVCGSKYISGFKAGTQKIEQVVKARFPQARVLRMDMDTTRTKDGYEQILSAFSNHEADILIGTQMIVKGHDFPGVTLVGVLAADLSLYISDYRASERTFQLLTQDVPAEVTFPAMSSYRRMIRIITVSRLQKSRTMRLFTGRRSSTAK